MQRLASLDVIAEKRTQAQTFVGTGQDKMSKVIHGPCSGSANWGIMMPLSRAIGNLLEDCPACLILIIFPEKALISSLPGLPAGWSV